MSCLIVNFFAGPGAAKSTMAAHTFAELKWMGLNCELATEYAKEKVWEGSFGVLNNQRLIYGKQYHMIWRPSEHVAVVVTDSPVLLSAIYAKEEDSLFKSLIIEDFKKFNNMNFFIKRMKPYVQAGRVQNEKEAKDKDDEIKNLLVNNQIEFEEVLGNRDSINPILNKIFEKLEKK